MKKTLLFLIGCISLVICPRSSVQAQPSTITHAKMPYRMLGTTYIPVSEIGLGCAVFEDQDTTFSRQFMTTAMAAGINYVDCYNSDPKVRDNLGYAIAGRRDKIIIQGHIGAYWENGQYKRTRNLTEAKAGFEDLLTRLHTDYIEVGMIHIADDMQDWEAIYNGPILKYAQSLKAQGKIKHIGLSSHNPEVALAAVRSGVIEVLMFSINPLFDLLPPNANLFESKPFNPKDIQIDSVRNLLYATCKQMGVGITVMKVVGGGRLLDAKQSSFGFALTPTQCIQYALDRPAVATALVGAQTYDELEADLHYLDATPAERDYASAFNKMQNGCWKGNCIYCNHCSPCPVGINIAKVTQLLNTAVSQDTVTPAMQKEYDALEHKAGECVGCGACETRCPFGVSVRENMKKAEEIFEHKK